MRGLLPISTGDPAFDLMSAAEGLADAGVSRLILREPHREAAALARLAEALMGRLPGLIVHARCPGGLELTRALGAGLHLPGGAARPDFDGLLGRSIHGEPELNQLQDADYALLSPVWLPSSKPDDRRPTLGPEGFAALYHRCSKPLFALGGIHPDRARILRELGVRRLAVQGWLFVDDSARGVAARANTLLRALAPNDDIV